MMYRRNKVLQSLKLAKATDGFSAFLSECLFLLSMSMEDSP